MTTSLSAYFSGFAGYGSGLLVPDPGNSLDVYIRAKRTNWTPGGGGNPYLLMGHALRWTIGISPAGYPVFRWRDGGSTTRTATSTELCGFTNNEYNWLEVYVSHSSGTTSVEFYVAPNSSDPDEADWDFLDQVDVTAASGWGFGSATAIKVGGSQGSPYSMSSTDTLFREVYYYGASDALAFGEFNTRPVGTTNWTDPTTGIDWEFSSPAEIVEDGTDPDPQKEMFGSMGAFSGTMNLGLTHENDAPPWHQVVSSGSLINIGSVS